NPRKEPLFGLSLSRSSRRPVRPMAPAIEPAWSAARHVERIIDRRAYFLNSAALGGNSLDFIVPGLALAGVADPALSGRPCSGLGSGGRFTAGGAPPGPFDENGAPEVVSLSFDEVPGPKMRSRASQITIKTTTIIEAIAGARRLLGIVGLGRGASAGRDFDDEGLCILGVGGIGSAGCDFD